jgi:hypothetical protein
MLIFGRGVRDSQGKMGEFFCPQCRSNQAYCELQTQRYTHFFFIPIFSSYDEPHGLQCSRCRGKFSFDVLQANVSYWACPKCAREWPETSVRCPVCKIRPNGTPA